MKQVSSGVNNKNQIELADVFRLYGKQYRRESKLPFEQLKVMRNIETCRTAALGGHVQQCDECGFENISYNSCRDRHCPKCQTMTKEQWLNDRKAELLPCGYFHLVFTLPHTLNPIILCNKKVTLTILFAAVSDTLQAFAKDPQWHLNGQLGFVSVLHTWNQTLLDHFHLHCLVPGGAFSIAHNRWTPSRRSFLFRIKSLAKEFKKSYLSKIEKAYRKDTLIFPGKTASLGSQKAFSKLARDLSEIDWIAYAKKPFAGPEQVIEYLGRYTHRVAISNNRIIALNNDDITISYRDRKNNNQQKFMTLKINEFIRRFLLHVLPSGFMKIRYFGFLANVKKRQCVAVIRKLINSVLKLPEKIKETIQQIMLRVTGIDISCCQRCKKGRMVTTKELSRLSWNTS